MSGVPGPPAKVSLGERFRKRFRHRSSVSPSRPTQTLTSSTAPPPGSPSTTSSSTLVAAHSPNASTAFSTPSPQVTSDPSSNRQLLSNALKRLSDRDQATLQDHILPNSNDIDLALRQALDAAEAKQQSCIEKRWTFTFAGRPVTLQEEADKVIRWLNRFKTVGDIAVNVDPMHAGLPWAGIRLLLEVRVSPSLMPTNLTFQSTGGCV